MKILLHNAENFFLDAKTTTFGLLKPVEKIEKIATIIKNENPDLIMLLEVGGLESLKIFNEHYLNNEYIPYLIPGNSDRGIEMGYLIKKDFPYKAEAFSHREREIRFNYPGEIGPSHKFSRDISELRLSKDNELKAIFFLVHLKSKWDRDGNDPNGIQRRKAELNTLVTVYNDYQKLFPNIPIIVAGDFNGVAQKNQCEDEFKSIYENTDLQDILELLPISSDEKFTYFQFTRDGKRLGFQLDYIFLPKSLQGKIIPHLSRVHRFLDQSNALLPLPISSFDRQNLPSDHYPVIATLDFLK